MSQIPKWLAHARDHWTWRGQERPPFAVTPGPGQESVWDYPRPPVIVPTTAPVLVRWGERAIARTERALRVLETAHPPSYYLPFADVDQAFLVKVDGGSFCEWKGAATYWSLVDGNARLDRVGWSYQTPLAGAELLRHHIAFYPTHLACQVAGRIVTAQPGEFYGGWVTDDLCGPFKGDPGSQGW